jgi:hypothetical protein
MSDIKSWSSTAASNTDATWGGMPEGMAPSAVNDNVRTQMAAHRTQWQDAEWFDWGHAPAYVSASTFTVSNSVTTVYAVGRRLKLYDGSSTLYGHVTSISAVSGTNTKFTVSLTSGNLTSSLSSVAVSILDPTNTSIPKGAVLDSPAVTSPTITTPTINTTVTGTALADQSAMETGSSTNLIVTPGRVGYYQGVPKFYAHVTFSAGTPSVTATWSINGDAVTVTDGGAGTTAVNFPVAFSATTTMCIQVTTMVRRYVYVTSFTTTGCTVVTENSSLSAEDANFFITVWGDL